MKLTELSNEQLLSGLHALVGQGRALLARLLGYLGEVEERRLDLESACSSLFDFCVRRLAMSEDEACRRVAAARLARRFPVVLDMIERGEIHLTGSDARAISRARRRRAALAGALQSAVHGECRAARQDRARHEPPGSPDP